MKPFTRTPDSRARTLRLRGQLESAEPLPPSRTALLVIDMQNYFVAEGQPGEVPPARGIVDTINTLAASARERGALVVWVQTDSTEARHLWARHHDTTLTPERALRRIAGLKPGSEGHALYPGMRPAPLDQVVSKVHYSAFIPASSDLDAHLRAQGVDTLLIAGTATNVCCDTSARDASMLGYRVIMVSDAMASWTEPEHVATLDIFGAFFGDVLSATEVIDRLAAGAPR